MNLTVIEYDKDNRVIYMYFPDSNIKYYFQYKSYGRIMTIVNEKNKSNYKSIIKQKLQDGDYKDFQITQFGETYDVDITYNDSGHEIIIERFNKIKDTKYKKQTFRSKHGTPIIWFENYNGEESLGFKVNLNKLLK
jgi:hypothetical protein